MKNVGYFDNLVQKNKKELIDNFWLGLGPTYNIATRNVFDCREFRDNPSLFIVDYMRKPENFAFTCRHLFGVQIERFQALILHELWHRPMPLLMASRGSSKTFTLALYSLLRCLFTPGSKVVVVGAAFRQAKAVFDYMEGIYKNSPMLQNLLSYDKMNRPSRDIDRCTFRIGTSTLTALPMGDGCLSVDSFLTYSDKIGLIGHETLSNEEHTIKRDKVIWGNGQFNYSDEFYCKGFQKTKKVTTERGFSYEGTYNHKMKVCRNAEIVWCRTDELQRGDSILIDRSERWHSGDISATNEQCFALGAMIGDGSYVRQYYLRYTTADQELIEKVMIGIPGRWKRQDKLHWQVSDKTMKREWMQYWGLKPSYCQDKEIPPTMLKASKEKIKYCLQGLYATEGHVQVSTAKGGYGITVGFTNTSQKLVKQMQYLLLHFGIVAYLKSRDRAPGRYLTTYELIITGRNVKKFAQKIGFGLLRKDTALLNGIANQVRDRSTQDGVPFAKELMLACLKKDKPKKGALGNGANSLSPTKISPLKTVTLDFVNKFVAVYRNFKSHLPEFQKLLKLADPNIYYDTVVDIKDSQNIVYDVHIPNTHEYCANGFFSHNTKIRGTRATHLLCDEKNAINTEIFDVVIRGFASVTAEPVENVKKMGRMRALQHLGVEADIASEAVGKVINNQIVIAGTPGYTFEPLYRDYVRHKAIIESRGDPRIIEEIFDGKPLQGFDWRDYSIIKFPYELIPEGFMDEKAISDARSKVHLSLFASEYGTCFIKDSDGFFKRSLIERCICGKKENQLIFPSCGQAYFLPTISGDQKRKYVFGVDPASEVDNFSIVILEVWPDHRRIVYCWTINRERHKLKLRKGIIDEHDYYRYCAKKIRDLMRLFPCERILMDSQQGGRTIMEIFGDPKALRPGEELIYEVEEEDEEKPTDGLPGLHIVELISFADGKWTADANHGMRKDMESRTLLFPAYNSAILGAAIAEGEIKNKFNEEGEGFDEQLYDTQENTILEIEDLKNELTTIVVTKTEGGTRERWDTPQVKGGASMKKGKLRKDRYSALLMANAGARVMNLYQPQIEYKAMGGVAQKIGGSPDKITSRRQSHNEPLYTGVGASKIDNANYGMVIIRR